MTEASDKRKDTGSQAWLAALCRGAIEPLKVSKNAMAEKRLRPYRAVALVILASACTTITPALVVDESVVVMAGPSGGEVIDQVIRNGAYTRAEQLSVRADYCAAATVTKDVKIIEDSSLSWVGPYTGHYYRGGTSTAVSGDMQVVKAIDRNAETVIFVGRENFYFSSVRSFVDFTATVKPRAEAGYTIVFSDLRHTMMNTGMSYNDGAMPVGVWKGSSGRPVVDALDGVHARFSACMNAR